MRHSNIPWLRPLVIVSSGVCIVVGLGLVLFSYEGGDVAQRASTLSLPMAVVGVLIVVVGLTLALQLRRRPGEAISRTQQLEAVARASSGHDEVADSMSRFLLVAEDKDDGTGECGEAVRIILGRHSDPVLTVLVPAQTVGHALIWDENETTEAALQTGTGVANALALQGVTVGSVRVGDKNPARALRDELQRHTYDEIIITPAADRGVLGGSSAAMVSRIEKNFPGKVHRLGSAQIRS